MADPEPEPESADPQLRDQQDNKVGGGKRLTTQELRGAGQSDPDRDHQARVERVVEDRHLGNRAELVQLAADLPKQSESVAGAATADILI